VSPKRPRAVAPSRPFGSAAQGVQQKLVALVGHPAGRDRQGACPATAQFPGCAVGLGPPVDSASAVRESMHGGTVGSFTGDSIMAVFGAPTALEDHAFRACLAALGVQEEAKRLAVDIQGRDGVDLRMRVGLNSGQADAAGGPAVLACWGGRKWRS
jgi:hypothetical protein